MSLFDKLRQAAAPQPPAHLVDLVKKVWPDATIELFTGQMQPMAGDYPMSKQQRIDAAVKAMRDSTRKERAARTRESNKRLRSVGIDPVHWARLCRNHFHAPPEVMDEIVAGYLRAGDKNAYSKLTHWEPPEPAPEKPRTTTRYVPGVNEYF